MERLELRGLATPIGGPGKRRIFIRSSNDWMGINLRFLDRDGFSLTTEQASEALGFYIHVQPRGQH
jgi:hypothetical protein